jgi:S-adenosylmethionine:tRNA-ribosyltransferase-isomerase (queuine synthetase)
MNVKILLRYIGALYVFNDKMEANIKLKTKKIEKEKMEFLVSNQGGKHQLLTNLKLKFKKDKEKEVIIDSNSLKLFTGENILAKSERLFKIPKTKEALNIDDSYEVELVFDKEK